MDVPSDGSGEMSSIHVRAGTEGRSSDCWFGSNRNDKGQLAYGTSVSAETFTFSGNYGSSASGSWYGQYRVYRVAKFSLPISVLIEFCTEALLKSDHKLSDGQIKRLLLGISASIATRDVKENP
jgi:hypothetical protein